MRFGMVLPMKTIYKILIIILSITLISTVLYNYTEFQFGNINYFDKHGWFFLFFLTFFPRVALFVAALFGNIAIGGPLWFLGYFFAPRVLVAILATASYWHTNQILVIISWLVAIGGESSEKIIISNRVSGKPKKFNHGFEGTTFEADYSVNGQDIKRPQTKNNNDVIEVEYKVKE